MWQRIRVSSLERHSHDAAYATVIIAGGYEEAGDQGRFRVKAGEVILHDRFEAHLDRFGRSGAALLNLRLPAARPFSPGAARIADPDLVLRTAERSRAEAVEVLLSMIQRSAATIYDWPDALAGAFWQDPSLRLLRWAEEHELPPWQVSRDFRRVYGTSPETFRAKVRAQRAWKMIRTTATPLIDIACSFGFADQSHMTRCVKQLTGMSPRALRETANGFKT